MRLHLTLSSNYCVINQWKQGKQLHNTLLILLQYDNQLIYSHASCDYCPSNPAMTSSHVLVFWWHFAHRWSVLLSPSVVWFLPSSSPPEPTDCRTPRDFCFLLPFQHGQVLQLLPRWHLPQQTDRRRVDSADDLHHRLSRRLPTNCTHRIDASDRPSWMVSRSSSPLRCGAYCGVSGRPSGDVPRRTPTHSGTTRRRTPIAAGRTRCGA